MMSSTDKILIPIESEPIASGIEVFHLRDGIAYLDIKMRRLKVKSNGKKFITTVPYGVSTIGNAALNNTLYFTAKDETYPKDDYSKFYKAEFRPNRGIKVFHLRDMHKDEKQIANSSAVFYLRKREGVPYYYRIFDDPDKDGIWTDISKISAAGTKLRAIHRGTFICSIDASRDHSDPPPSAERLSHNVIRIKFDDYIDSKSRWRQRSYGDDSSPFFYVSSGPRIHVLNVTTLQFLPSLRFGYSQSVFADSIVSVKNGVIALFCCTYTYPAFQPPIKGSDYFITARLPNGYFQDGKESEEKHKPSQANANDNDVFRKESVQTKEFDSEFLRKFEPIRVIGQGAFGCVFEAKSLIDEIEYAVKRIPMRGSAEAVNQSLKEVRVLATLKHEGIVGYNSSWIEYPPENWQIKSDLQLLSKLGHKEMFNYRADCVFIYIQMELCEQTLYNWLHQNKERDLNRAKLWFKQVVSAVAYIHHNGKIHRDLKPSYILIDKCGRLKICDLGLVADRAIKDGTEIDQTRTMMAGTEMYMAPEQIYYTYTSKVDIFTLGLILTELCLCMTMEQAKDVFMHFRQGTPTTVLKHLPEVDQFVSWLTAVEPSHRPKCEEILTHEFLAVDVAYSESIGNNETSITRFWK